MPSKDDCLARLERLFAELPGLGPRSASRLVTQMLSEQRELAIELLHTLSEAIDTVQHCECCHTLTTQSLCPVCANPQRDHSTICVVEMPADVDAIEASVAYRGTYFVLMGRVNPLAEVGPEQLGIQRLLDRLATGEVHEVVMATSFTPEGETTAHFVATLIKRKYPAIRVTRLSRGLPAGVEVEYTDPASVAAAIIDRKVQ